MEKSYKVSEVVELGLLGKRDKYSIYNLISKGKLRAKNISSEKRKVYLITESAIREFLEN